MLNRSASLAMSTGSSKTCLVNLISKDTHLVFSIDTVVDHCIHDCFFLNLDRSMLWYAIQQLNSVVIYLEFGQSIPNGISWPG